MLNWPFALLILVIGNVNKQRKRKATLGSLNIKKRFICQSLSPSSLLGDEVEPDRYEINIAVKDYSFMREDRLLDLNVIKWANKVLGRRGFLSVLESISTIRV